MTAILVVLLIKTVLKGLAKILYAMQITQILVNLIFICIIVNISLPLVYLIVACVLILVFILVIFTVYMYKKNNDSLPKWLFYGLSGLAFGAVSSVMVVGFVLDSISDFIAFSVTLLTFAGVGLGVSTFQLYNKAKNRYVSPTIYSAYGLPVYRFDSTTEILQKTELFVYIHFIALILLVVYS